MYTAQQIATVINYNSTGRIFSITANKRVMWDVRNGDIAKLQQQGVVINTQQQFNTLKKQVRAALVAEKQL